ncbi:chaperonin 10-like protein [Mycena galericulata]|nr:chaperonin 10-like protein [Mycena galericulata]
MPSYTIPKTQTAAVVPTSGAAIEIHADHPVKTQDELAPGECLIKLSCTGVCHTDLHAALGDWPVPPKAPLVGGHEGVGVIVAIGNNTSQSPVKVGDRVGIKWLADSCLNCEQCRKGREQNCLNAKLSGYTVDGTFQQYVVRVEDLANNGVTVYRAIKYSQTSPGDWIVLPGAGGGLGHLGMSLIS